MINSDINSHTLTNKNIIKKANNLFYFCKDIKHLNKNSIVTKNAIRTLNYLDFINHPYVESLAKDLEEEFFYNTNENNLLLIKNNPYSIKYIHSIEFLKKGHELIHKNTKEEDYTIIIGLNDWKPGSSLELSFNQQSIKYPFQFKTGGSVLFRSSVAREISEVLEEGDRMLVVSLKKDPSKKELMDKRNQDIFEKHREILRINRLKSKGKFSRFWRGLKNGINIFR